MPFDRPVAEVIRARFACRAYKRIPVAAEQARRLEAAIASLHAGPLNTPLRFELALAMPHDPKALRSLGTYGLIRDPAGFIIGAVRPGPGSLEDFGYGMEYLVLYATSLGLDTCWLGGNFTKGSFAKRIGATADEIVPGVASIGYAADQIRSRDPLRLAVKSDTRRPWSDLFFESDFTTPLPEETAGAYAPVLEMARLAPSSHNYQPWRIVRDNGRYHFYLQRTLGYGPDSPMFRLLGVADLQRVDMGIAMSHFELAARELGLEGQWERHESDLRQGDVSPEYVVTWRG